MKNNQSNSRGAATPKTAIFRQMIVSAVALVIVGVGAWSLLGQQAPYHPDISGEEVSRDGSAELMNVNN
jgi:hypothetical protein